MKKVKMLLFMKHRVELLTCRAQ